MKRLRLLGPLLLACLFSLGVVAQTKVDVSYTSKEKLIVNKLELSKKTKMSKIVELLGEPDRTSTSKVDETANFYENLRVVVITKNDLMVAFGMNFTWDNAENYPEKSFIGNLNIADYVVTTDSKLEDFSAISSIAISCPISIMCGIGQKDTKTKGLVTFNDDGIMNEVTFLLQ
tara:strand:+ start:107 stop:628 length:522 start_codon:yes stop_codon:yes gene_type:complete